MASIATGLSVGYIGIVILIVCITWIILIKIGYDFNLAYKLGMIKQHSCGEIYLEGETPRSSIYDYYTGKKDIKAIKKKLETLFRLFFVSILLSIIPVIIYFSYVIIKANTISDRITAGIITVLSIVLLSIWNAFSKDTSKSTINPFNNVIYAFGNTITVSKDQLIGTQISLLIPILITFILAKLYGNFSWWGGNSPELSFPSSIGTILIVSCIIVLILLPFISTQIYDLNENIEDYYSDKIDKINEAVTEEVDGNTEANKSVRNLIARNIQSLENLSEIPDKNNLQGYANEYYRYVVHTPNLAEIRAVTLPTEMNEIIDPTYFKSEIIIKLKYDLLAYYQSTDKSTAMAFNIRPYLKTSYQSAINETTGLAVAGKERDHAKIREILTSGVINNDSYKFINALPGEVQSILIGLRSNTQMEDTAQKFFKLSNILSILLFTIIFYGIFHRLYANSINGNVRQSLALVVLILMVALAFIGLFLQGIYL
uniref:Uncharacterized protein n=1 Tax=viral metagenome TaxID=1070528 RepID=A0A6C0CSY4_9ZZZZ